MPNSDHGLIGPDRFRAARAAHEWTQRELAERVGVTRNTIAAIERGTPVRLSTRLAVLRALGIGEDAESSDRARLLTSLTDAELLAEVAARMARRT